jgi:hypothetical protein
MKFKCKKCGYNWESKVKEPKQCTRCKRFDYFKKNDQSGRGIPLTPSFFFISLLGCPVDKNPTHHPFLGAQIHHNTHIS